MRFTQTCFWPSNSSNDTLSITLPIYLNVLTTGFPWSSVLKVVYYAHSIVFLCVFLPLRMSVSLKEMCELVNISYDRALEANSSEEGLLETRIQSQPEHQSQHCIHCTKPVSLYCS